MKILYVLVKIALFGACIYASVTYGFFRGMEYISGQAAINNILVVEALKALGFEHLYWHSAEKKGYSGVTIFSKVKPDKVVLGMGEERFDKEGRVIRADFGDLTILNCYFPSGTSGDIRQEVKYDFLDTFYDWVQELKKERPNLIIQGDYNIAHTEMDIHNPKTNKKSSGFLPEERAWMDKWFANNMLDSFKSKRHIVNLGHGVYPDIHPDKVRTFINTVKNYRAGITWWQC